MLITNAADDILLIIIIVFFSEKIRIGISCELSAEQTIHMKYQVLFSLKKVNKIRMTSSTILLTL